MTEIYLNQPRVEGRRIYYSWTPNVLFKGSEYYVEYLDLKEINTTPSALLEGYLAVCLVFGVLGDVVIHMPGELSPDVLKSWYRLIEDASRKMYKERFNLKIVESENEAQETNENKGDGFEVGLLFGGGTESLLALGRLLDQKTSPFLLSLWGSQWRGSELDINKDRFALEEDLAKEFHLKMFRVTTNLKSLIDSKDFYPYLKNEANIFNAVLFLPINLSLVYPVMPQLKIKKIISGNEKESSSDREYYSLSSEMTKNLENCSQYAKYFSDLESLYKIEVIRDLHIKYPELGKYQFSCWRSSGRRWCLKCEKCLRNFIVYRIFDVEPSRVGIEEDLLVKDQDHLLWEIRNNATVKEEWRSIYLEAQKKNKTEIARFIRPVFQNILVRRINFALKRLKLINERR